MFKYAIEKHQEEMVSLNSEIQKLTNMKRMYQRNLNCFQEFEQKIKEAEDIKKVSIGTSIYGVLILLNAFQASSFDMMLLETGLGIGFLTITDHLYHKRKTMLETLKKDYPQFPFKGKAFYEQEKHYQFFLEAIDEKIEDERFKKETKEKEFLADCATGVIHQDIYYMADNYKEYQHFKEEKEDCSHTLQERGEEQSDAISLEPVKTFKKIPQNSLTSKKR